MAVVGAMCSMMSHAQLMYPKEKIYSAYTLQNEKATQRKAKLIAQANSLNTLLLDSNESEIESALWAVSQFLVRTPQSDSGIAKLVQQFQRMPGGMQRSLLEILYGMYPTEYSAAVKNILTTTDHPKTFSQAAVYLYRNQPQQAGWIRQQMVSKFPEYAQNDLLLALDKYLNATSNSAVPSFDSLFAYQQIHKYKVVYSFQRKNRDFPGLAVVQQADGRFAREENGQLKTFVQLARSASNFPFFLTNGSTPQGLYTITGTGISQNVFIGPTPNLQMSMMHEVNTPKFTHYFPIVFNAPPEKIYRSYFPESWQNWAGLMEAYDAGKIGRGAIIAHGTTIDPSWYSGKSFYPISPTLGCLCGREIWDGATGKIKYSDQLELVNTFIETQGTQGYMMVINIDDKQAPVSPEEIDAIVKKFELSLPQ